MLTHRDSLLLRSEVGSIHVSAAPRCWGWLDLKQRVCPGCATKGTLRVIEGRQAIERMGGGMEFDEFVEVHLAALGRYAGALTGDRHLAEDVLSDALIATSARWDLIGQMEYPLAYVRRIVASTFVADRRRHQRRRTTVQADPGCSLPSPGDPQGRMDDRDELDRLLRELTPTQRAAVVMRFYLDLPDTEIAHALGCSLGNVRSTISRALTALRLTQAAERS